LSSRWEKNWIANEKTPQGSANPARPTDSCSEPKEQNSDVPAHYCHHVPLFSSRAGIPHDSAACCDAAIETKIGCHTFRATGITAYLKNCGHLEMRRKSPRN
jgi:hypothetical protein